MEWFISLEQKANPVMCLTETGLNLREDLSYEQWLTILGGFKRAHNALTLGLADCIAFGERKWGKVAVDAALGQLEFDMPTVNTAMAINSIPDDIRDDRLTAAHYVVLKKADIKPAERARWAKTAAEQNLSPGQLKASIPVGEVVNPAAAKALNHGILSPHGLRNQFDIWLERLGGAKGILKMGKEKGMEYVTDIIRELEPIHDLIAELKADIAKPVERVEPAKAVSKRKK